MEHLLGLKVKKLLEGGGIGNSYTGELDPKEAQAAIASPGWEGCVPRPC